MKPKQLIITEITSLSKDGHGLAIFKRPDDTEASIEVPFTLPGDCIKATRYPRKRGLYQGKLQEILIPSPSRIPARCQHFGTCGGCLWQPMPYDDQLIQKQVWIRKFFNPLLNEKTSLHPIIPCDPPWNYRNKMEFTFSSDKNEPYRLGMVIRGSRGKAFKLQECHLCAPWFTTAVLAVRQWWSKTSLEAYFPPANRGSLRTLTLREGVRTGDRMLILTVSGNPEAALNRQQLDDFTTAVIQAATPPDPQQQLAIFLRIQQIGKGRATQFFEMHLHGAQYVREQLHIQPFADDKTVTREFQISPTAFFQPNTLQAERLYSRALALANIAPWHVVYDLYCGTGTIGISAAPWAKQIIGIESQPESVLDARENAKANGCCHLRIYQGAVHEVLARETLPPPDIIIVDPPRSGLDQETVQHLIQLAPKKIIYISCHPRHQAENVAKLIESGYDLTDIQPVDQFPHTAHIENIAVLKLKNWSLD